MNEKVMLRGFPEEISEYIELPNMAELLTYPIFFDTPIEEAYKYGTDFQRKLISMTPLRNSKKFISILSEVRILDPYSRSCTGFNEQSMLDNDLEWHIDIEESEGESDNSNKYNIETDIVHLLTSAASSMTEFNQNEIELDYDTSKNSRSFMEYLYENRQQLGLQGKPMPSNQIVTFTNHMHRARPSTGVEFKYMYRIVETNRRRPPSPTYNKYYSTRIMTSKGILVPNVSQESDRIILHLPDSIKKSLDYRPGPDINEDEHQFVSRDSSSLSLDTSPNVNRVVIPGADEINELTIDSVYWESSGLGYSSELHAFTERNTIMLIAEQDFFKEVDNSKLLRFLDLVDRNVTIRDSDGQTFTAKIEKGFFSVDSFLGPIAGSYIQLTQDQADSLKKNVEYEIIFNESATHKFVLAPGVTFRL